MRYPEFNDVIHNNPINTLGFKTKLRTKNGPYYPLSIQISNFQIDHFTFYETSNNALCE